MGTPGDGIAISQGCNSGDNTVDCKSPASREQLVYHVDAVRSVLLSTGREQLLEGILEIETTDEPSQLSWCSDFRVTPVHDDHRNYRSDIDADHQPLHVTATRPIPRGDVLGFILGRFMPAAEAESILTAAADSPTEIDDLAQHMFSFTVFQAPSSNSSSDKQQQDDEECLGKDITLLADSCAQTNPLAKVLDYRHVTPDWEITGAGTGCPNAALLPVSHNRTGKVYLAAVAIHDICAHEEITYNRGTVSYVRTVTTVLKSQELAAAAGGRKLRLASIKRPGQYQHELLNEHLEAALEICEGLGPVVSRQAGQIMQLLRLAADVAQEAAAAAATAAVATVKESQNAKPVMQKEARAAVTAPDQKRTPGQQQQLVSATAAAATQTSTTAAALAAADQETATAVAAAEPKADGNCTGTKAADGLVSNSEMTVINKPLRIVTGMIPIWGSAVSGTPDSPRALAAAAAAAAAGIVVTPKAVTPTAGGTNRLPSQASLQQPPQPQQQKTAAVTAAAKAKDSRSSNSSKKAAAGPEAGAVDEADCIQKLVQHLSSTEEAKRRSAANALLNLAYDSADTRAIIAQCGAIPPLVAMLHSGNSEPCQVAAAAALANLAIDSPANQAAIGDAGGLQSLLSLLRDGGEGVQNSAARALNNLAWDAENRVFIAAAGGISYFVRLLRSKDEDTQENAAAALMNLARDVVYGIPSVIASAGAVPELVDLLDSPSRHDQEAAAGALMNLAYSTLENRDIIADAGGIPPLVALLSSTSPGIQRSAAGGVKNLTQDNPQNQTAVAAAGAIPALVRLLSSSDGDVLFESTGALWNIVFDHPDNQVLLAAAGGLQALVQLLCDSSCEDDVKWNAAGALRNAAHRNPPNQARVAAAGGIPALVTLLSSGHQGVQQEAAGALLTLASLNIDNRLLIAQAGALGPLINLLYSNFAQEEAAGALKYLVHDNPENAAVVTAHAGAVEALQMLATKSSNKHVARNAVAALRNLGMEV